MSLRVLQRATQQSTLYNSLLRASAPLATAPDTHRHRPRTAPSLSSAQLRSARALSTSSAYDVVANSSADYLLSFHNAVSLDILPWSVTLPLAALSLRAISFPVTYYSQLHAGRAALASKELPRIHHFVINTPGTLWQKYRTFRRLRNLILRSAGTAPVHQFPWHLSVHIPLFISASIGVRTLAMRAPADWHTAGPFFAPDLLAADPTCALPLLTTALWLYNLDPSTDARRRATSAATRDIPHTKRSRLVDTLVTRVSDTFFTTLQVIAVFSLTFTTQMPTGVVLFWASNAVITAVQRFVLSREAVRKRIGLVTRDDITNVPHSNIMPAIGQSVEALRKELSYIQHRMNALFRDRAADNALCADVNRMLQRERWSGRVAADLQAVLRKDDRNGRTYVAVVQKESLQS